MRVAGDGVREFRLSVELNPGGTYRLVIQGGAPSIVEEPSGR